MIIVKVQHLGSFAERQMLLLGLVLPDGFPDQQRKLEFRSESC